MGYKTIYYCEDAYEVELEDALRAERTRNTKLRKENEQLTNENDRMREALKAQEWAFENNMPSEYRAAMLEGYGL